MNTKTSQLLLIALAVLSVGFYLGRQSEGSHDTSMDTSQSGGDPVTSAAPSKISPHSDQSSPILTSPSSGSGDMSENLNQETNEALASLSGSEQKSLWKAFAEARLAVRPIPKSWAQREENLGYDFYALHPKQNMTTRFGSNGVQIVSSERTYTEEDSKRTRTAWKAQMHLVSLAGRKVPQGTVPKESEQGSSKVEYRHNPELVEWFDNGVEGMEHGYTIAERPSNLEEGEDVSLEVALQGLRVTERFSSDRSETLSFMHGEREILSYSKLIVVDSNGRELPATMKPSTLGFTLAYNDAQAVYPVTVDPLIVNEEAKFNRFHVGDGDRFGFSVAISGDTAVIGADSDDDGGSDSGSAFVFLRIGDFWSLHRKLTADDAAADDEFGKSVAISGDTIVVGATGDQDGGSDSGSAYVFVRSSSTWIQQAKLTAGDAAVNDNFGKSVGISGDTVVVGSHENGPGSAYVFVRSGSNWSQQDKLTASDAANNDDFGWAVAISDESVVVGARRNDDAGSDSGSAYVFARSGSAWSEQARLTASDAATGDNFGGSVGISGNSVVVGARRDDDAGDDSGSAYVFVRSGSSWTQQGKLNASDDAAGDSFGAAVGISDDYMIVGAYGDDDVAPGSGSAYVFVRSGSSWTQQSKLTAGDAASFDTFGWSVAISGHTVVAGAYLDDSNAGNSTGSAYVYVRNGATWTQQRQLKASDADAGDDFGYAVAISGDTAVVGTLRDGAAGSWSGSAYVFIRSDRAWAEQGKLTANDAAGFDQFGVSVSISGDLVVIGAHQYTLGASDAGGSAYVFVRSGVSWSQQSKLTASDAASSDQFGYSVGISGDSVIVGAYWDDDAGTASGSAYVFARIGTTWTQQAKLVAGDAAAVDQFGISVAISNDSAIVGADRDDHSGENDAGSAYVFTRSGSTWSQQAKLTDSNPDVNEYFGISVAIAGDSAVVGAYQDIISEESKGSAYVFVRNGTSWTQNTRLTAGNVVGDHLFGQSVSISGNSVAIGAPRGEVGGSQTGIVYVFLRSEHGWFREGVINANDGSNDDYFGGSVAISGDTVIMGALSDDEGESSSGSIYIYRLTLPIARNLLVFDHLGLEILNEGSAATFPGQLLGSSGEFIFRMANAGGSNLDIESMLLAGANAEQFALTLPDISSSADIGSSESLNFTISFQPAGITSGIRNASVVIRSNDSIHPKFTIDVSALGLLGTEDGDGDGINDWGEYSLRGFGFDWEIPQPGLVNDLYSQAHTVGLYTEDQVGVVAGSASIFNVDPGSNSVDLVFELEQSLDLNTFTKLTLDPSKLSIDGDGNIRYQHETTADRKFFQAIWNSQ